MSKRNLKKANAREVEQKEFEEETLQIDRVTRVVKGGRRMRFRITMVIGDRRGRVGVGIAKANEVADAMRKAVSAAKKNIIRVPMAEGDTIPHPVTVKYKASHLWMAPALPGTGVKAGGSLRKILSLAGVKNVLSKSFGSNNRVVTAQASMLALKQLAEPRQRKPKTEPQA